jgi:RNA polymerase sigma-70 factor (ECF subfamily)
MARGCCATWQKRSECDELEASRDSPSSCYARARMEDATDAELLRCIAESGPRQTAAEAVLCRRFAPRIRLYGLKHLRDPDRTRDLTQTVLVAVLQAARDRRIEDPQRVDRFVFGTCRNTVARMRQRSAKTVVAPDDIIAELATVPAPATELNALFECLAKLEQRARQVLMMTFIEERSADEIALSLSINAGNVRVIRHRALGSLRQCLDPGGEASQ